MVEHQLPKLGVASSSLVFRFLLVAVAVFGFSVSTAQAGTFEVNDTGDGADIAVNSICDASSAAGIQCTLRAAIQEVNGNAGAHAITFNIPGDGVHKIQAASSYPTITKVVAIDGYTQPGASPNTSKFGKPLNTRLKISTGGSSLSFGTGSSGSSVRGLAIGDINSGVAIVANITPVLTVQGNFIGTNAKGTKARFTLGGFAATGGTGSLVGGGAPADRNLVSGTAGGMGANSGWIARGNYIGVQADGKTPLPNVGQFSVLNFFGGDGLAERNLIAFNKGGGISVPNNDTRVLMTRNLIFANGKKGETAQIDLSSNGPTPNDPMDSDAGPNLLQNFPRLTSAKTKGKTTKVKGTLNSTPSSEFVIELFSTTRNAREARRYLGEVPSVTTDPSGNGKFSFETKSKLPKKTWITATTTGAGGLFGVTSEISGPVKVKR